jgi:hypothetical protein
MPNPFYGIATYSAPVAPYGYGGYGYGYTSFSPYSAYGLSQPYPIYVFLPRTFVPGRPVVYRPPIGTPIRTPVYSSPRPVFSRPMVPARPVVVHK